MNYAITDVGHGHVFTPEVFPAFDKIPLWCQRRILAHKKREEADVARWVMVRGKEGVHLHDCANFPLEEQTQTRMFKTSPENWWRCIRAEHWKGTRGVFVISPASLGLWAERLFTLLHAVDATVDLQDYKRSVKER